MAKIAGKAGHVSIDGTDISLDVVSVDFPLDIQDLDVTGFTSVGHERIAGLEDATMTVRAVFNDAASRSHAVLSGAADSATLSVIYGPKGSTGGFPKIMMTCLCTNISYNATPDGRAEISATFALSDPTNGWVITTF